MKHNTIRAMACALALTGLLVPSVMAEDPAAAETTAAVTSTSQSVDMTSALLKGLEATLPTAEQKVQEGAYAAAEQKLRDKEAQEAQIKAAQEEQARLQKEAEEKAAQEAAAEAEKEKEAEAETQAQPQRSASGVYQGNSVTNYDIDGSYDGVTYTSANDDENALRVTYARISVSNSTISKTGGTSTSDSDTTSYGLNAALLGTGNSGTNVATSNITSDAAEAPAVFSYGKSTFIRLTDSSIATTGVNSPALMAAGNGKISAENDTVVTRGNSSPAITIGNGGGIISVNGGTYSTEGTDAPVIRSAGGVTVSKAHLASAQSEAVRIAGYNAALLSDTDVESTGADYAVIVTRGTDDNNETGHSEFTMNGGSITAHDGGIIYVTNTKATIKLSNATFAAGNADNTLMTIAGNDGTHYWGEAGTNGAEAEVFFENENATGNITVDQYSRLNLILSNFSTLNGTINIVNNESTAAAYEARKAAATDDNPVPDAALLGRADVVVGEGSTWNLTADAHISTLMCMGTIVYNGHTITLADGTVMKE